MSPLWVSAFLDLEASAFDVGAAFWSGVTGYAVSPARGDDGEFATLVPPAGDDFLRVQRRREGASRVHLDVHVTDPRAAVDDAVALGARVEAQPDHGYVVLTSPAGLTFCLVSHRAAVRPPPAVWSGARSLVDQVCLDVGPTAYDAECAFWRDLTGCEHRGRPGSEFSSLVRPQGQPLRLLLQRVGDEREPASAHLDLACDDRAAEVARHQALGAVVLRRHEHFTVLLDPTGSPYCITDRSVETGLLG